MLNMIALRMTKDMRGLGMLPVPPCYLSPRAQIELAINVSEVGFYRVDGDVEDSGNLTIALSISNELYDLSFPVRECCQVWHVILP